MGKQVTKKGNPNRKPKAKPKAKKLSKAQELDKQIKQDLPEADMGNMFNQRIARLYA